MFKAEFALTDLQGVIEEYWEMENKLQTLQLIYDIVKKDIKPSTSIIHPNEIISRQHFPWDEIVNHLNELQTDGYITMKPVSPAIISITDKGFLFASSFYTLIPSLSFLLYFDLLFFLCFWQRY